MDAFPEFEFSSAEPSPSRLAALPVYGIGSPLQESLPSYIARLAAAHGVTVHHLLSREVVPRAFPGQKVPASNLLRHYSRVLLAGDGIARRVALTVSELSSSPAVVPLVYPGLPALCRFARDWRRHFSWCPTCLRELEEAGRPIYFPLLWAFREVRCCAKHGTALNDACPRCGHRAWFLAGSAPFGKCPRCALPFSQAQAGPAAIPLEMRVATWTGAFLEWLSSPHASDRATFRGNLRSAANVAGGGKPLAAVLDLSPCIVGFWVRGCQKPTFGSLARLSLAFNVPLSAWFAAPISLPAPSPVDRGILWLRDRSPRVPAEQVRAGLQSSLDSSAAPPPSLVTVARNLSVSPSHLYRAHRSLAAEVVQRHRAFVTACKTRRADEARALVSGAIARLSASGTTVTLEAVAQDLGSKWPRSRRRLKAVFQEVQHPSPATVRCATLTE